MVGANVGVNKRGARFCKQCVKDLRAARRAANRVPPPTIEERFWAKVDKCGPIRKRALGRCWVWTAAVNHNGYGIFGASDGRSVKAHRWAYELLVGPIPKGKELHQRCRNPECVRPSHLKPVTHAENMRLGWEARKSHKNATCPKGHDLTVAANVYRYREEWKCRICRDTPRPGVRSMKRRVPVVIGAHGAGGR